MRTGIGVDLQPHRRKSFLRALTITVGLLVGPAIHFAAESNPPPARVWATKLVRPGLTNLAQVTTNLFRCAQPEPRGFRELEAMGVRTVLSLRGFTSDRGQTESTNLRLLRISFKTWHPEEEDVVRFLRLVTDTNNGPVAVHCLHGSDRTGMMIAIYRMAVQGWSKDEAIKEMTDGGFGFHAIWQNLVSYLRKLDIERLRRQAGLVGQKSVISNQ